MLRRENIFKKHLLAVMGSTWDVQSHEDKYSDGIPDLSYGLPPDINGWIELKQIKEWPVRPDTKVKPDHYTAQQVNWLVKRGKKSNRCFVMVKVGKDEYFLFHWGAARDIRHGMTKEEYFKTALHHWQGKINSRELMLALTYSSFII